MMLLPTTPTTPEYEEDQNNQQDTDATKVAYQTARTGYHKGGLSNSQHDATNVASQCVNRMHKGGL